MQMTYLTSCSSDDPREVSWAGLPRASESRRAQRSRIEDRHQAASASALVLDGEHGVIGCNRTRQSRPVLLCLSAGEKDPSAHAPGSMSTVGCQATFRSSAGSQPVPATFDSAALVSASFLSLVSVAAASGEIVSRTISSTRDFGTLAK